MQPILKLVHLAKQQREIIIKEINFLCLHDVDSTDKLWHKLKMKFPSGLDCGWAPWAHFNWNQAPFSVFAWDHRKMYPLLSYKKKKKNQKELRRKERCLFRSEGNNILSDHVLLLRISSQRSAVLPTQRLCWTAASYYKGNFCVVAEDLMIILLFVWLTCSDDYWGFSAVMQKISSSLLCSPRT